MNSTHKCEVVAIALEPHGNADSLSVVRFAGYTVVVRTADWQGKAFGIYIPPDSLIPLDNPVFSFITTNDNKYTRDSVRLHGGGYARIKAKKLRGVVSYGLLVPAPDGALPGDDLAEQLGVLHYDPPLASNTKGETTSAPNLYSPKYDVDSFLRYASEVFIEGEDVHVTEKIHGCLQADTLVLMANGTEKPIKDVNVNDTIKSYKDGVLVNSQVLNKLVRPQSTALKWVKLTFDNGQELVCTTDHRILTSNRGWVEANSLNDEDYICGVQT